MTNIGILYSFRDLLFAWAMRTIRARYKQSLLGGLWAIIQPAATVAIFSIIFILFVPVDTGDIPYVVFSYTAMVPWMFFSGSIMDMVDSLVGNMGLVSKIYFPREVLPIAALLARGLDFIIAEALLIVLILFYQMPIYLPGLLVFPIILGTQMALTLGLGLIGAAINVFFRDMRHVFTLGLQMWLYASPIIYPVTAVPERFQPFYYINPMAGVIEAFRAVLLYETLPGPNFIISLSSAVVILIIGYWFFKRVEFKFADVI